ncbi:MAG: PQQ-binding-like beta-propeller repeat protein [Nanoarchaeota archaeon]|nr:PQQ-like beta-propeller repeat protein [Nanoarchaeota archaeon]
MDKYIIKEDSGLRIQTEVAPGYTDIDVFAVIKAMTKYERPVTFEIGTGGSISCQPIIHKDMIYFGACDHNFYCLDMNGNEIWRFGTNGPIVFDCSIHDDIIYFGCFDHNVYALSLEGKLLWRFGTEDMVGSKPKVINNILYFGSKDGKMYAINPKTGKLIWKFKTNGAICAGINAYEDRLYFGSWDNNLYCLNAKTGKLVWKYAANNTVATALEYNGNIFFGSFDHCFRSVTSEGKLRWKFKAGGPITAGAGYAVADNIIYFCSRDTHMYAVDTDTGKIVWKFPTGEMIVSPPVYHNNVVYFSSGDSNLYAVEAKTGKLIWKKPFTLPVASIGIYEDIIYAGCWDCNLYALSLERKTLWKFSTSLSYPAPIDLEQDQIQSNIEINWETSKIEKEKELYKTEVNAGDYSDLTSVYGDISRLSYMSNKNTGYVKKRDF